MSLWWPSLGSEASFRGCEYMRPVGQNTAPRPTVRLPHHCFTEWGVTGFDIWLCSPECQKRPVSSVLQKSCCPSEVGGAQSCDPYCVQAGCGGPLEPSHPRGVGTDSCSTGPPSPNAREGGARTGPGSVATPVTFIPPGSPGSARYCPGSPLMSMF